MNAIKYEHFHKIVSAEKAASDLAEKIRSRLDEDQEVLWLVSGGSATEVATDTADIISREKLSKLSIGLVDERFGGIGHADSNWQQLISHGFSAAGAKMHPILQGGSIQKTVADYKKFVDRCLDPTVYKIALLGLGADGHIAGILPGSPAVDAQDTVIAYKGPDFVRITMTVAGLLRLDEGFVYAMGESKRQAIEALLSDEEPPIEQYPAGVISRIPKWSVYNDLVGEAI